MARRATLFFVSFWFLEEKLFPLKMGYFCSFFSVSLPFSLTLSLSLSFFCFLSLSLLFLSFFLPCFLSCFVAFLSLPCFSLLVSCKEQHQTITLESFCSINPFCVFCFPSCFVSQIPLSYLCFVRILMCVLFNINVLSFTKDNLSNTIFWWSWWLQQTFLITYVL